MSLEVLLHREFFHQDSQQVVKSQYSNLHVEANKHQLIKTRLRVCNYGDRTSMSGPVENIRNG